MTLLIPAKPFYTAKFENVDDVTYILSYRAFFVGAFLTDDWEC